MRFVPHHILRGCCRVEIGVEVLGTGSEPWRAAGTVVKLIQANKGLNANSLLLIRCDNEATLKASLADLAHDAE